MRAVPPRWWRSDIARARPSCTPLPASQLGAFAPLTCSFFRPWVLKVLDHFNHPFKARCIYCTEYLCSRRCRMFQAICRHHGPFLAVEAWSQILMRFDPWTYRPWINACEQGYPCRSICNDRQPGLDLAPRERCLKSSATPCQVAEGHEDATKHLRRHGLFGGISDMSREIPSTNRFPTFADTFESIIFRFPCGGILLMEEIPNNHLGRLKPCK